MGESNGSSIAPHSYLYELVLTFCRQDPNGIVFASKLFRNSIAALVVDNEMFANILQGYYWCNKVSILFTHLCADPQSKHLHTSTPSCIHASTHARTPTYTPAHKHTCKHATPPRTTHIHSRAHTHTRAPKHARAHASTHVHMYRSSICIALSLSFYIWLTFKLNSMSIHGVAN